MKDAVTKVIDTLTQEDFHGAFQMFLERLEQMYCRRRWLIRRWLEFHVCTINKSAHTKNVWKLYLMILVYIIHIRVNQVTDYYRVIYTFPYV